MSEVKQLLLLLVGVLLAACSRILITPMSVPISGDVTPEIAATGTAKDGLSIAVAVIAVDSTHRVQVMRGRSVFWLKASDSPNKYGCEIEYPSYDTFGCYFYLDIRLVDLDADKEAEVTSLWEHDGSGGYKSFHLHRWDGSTYQLVGDFLEQQLEVELQDLNDDGQQELILQYDVGPHQLAIPWVDVYTLSGGQLISANKEYPAFYEALLGQYEEMLPDYEAAAKGGWSEALVELKQRIEMAKIIIGDEGS